MSITHRITNPVARPLPSTVDSVIDVGGAPTNATIDFDGTDARATGTVFDDLFDGDFTIEFDWAEDVATGWLFDTASAMPCIILYSGAKLGFGTLTGWNEFTFTDGLWRFIHDTSETGMDRWRAFLDGVEQTTTGPNGSYAQPNVFNGTTANIGRRSNGSSYVNGQMTGFRLWNQISLPGDTQSTGLQLDLTDVSGSTWLDKTANADDFTLAGGWSEV